MAITGNKGEWSEIYTLFRLLGEGIVHAGDANLNKLDLYYPIINIIREESNRYEYKPNQSKNIVVIDEDGHEYARISMDKFMSESKSLLDAIKETNQRSFAVPSAECFMSKIGCRKLKAPSKDKADIHIVIHDLRTNMTPLLGFSIKSQLGSASTLLNATEATNIRYLVSGKKMTDAEIVAYNNIEDHMPRMEALVKNGYKLRYSGIEHNTFKNNLLFLDTYMPEFIAACLICDSMPNSTSKISEAVEIVANQNPFGFTGSDIKAFYEHKMKVLLLDAALGMTPAKEWKGRYDANGGYLVVRRDGEIVCYHFYNRNDVEDYLYHNTRFERGSRSRHHFGTLYRGNDGKVYIKLNLQIRFCK
ncbi:MAG: HpaII family restriction endonuclease [Bacteroidales bacterium]|nr:HpaII family restriction endonuclease [Bacteroidales bacterium]